MSYENLSIRELVAFRAVVESGGVNAAARRLGISRSLVSKRLSDLEVSLGVKLMHRSTTQSTLTDGGELFYARAEALLENLEQVANELRSTEEGLSGSFRVSVPVDAMNFFLCTPILSFAQQHLDLKLTVDLDDRVVDLSAQSYDVAIRIGRLQQGAFKARKLCVSPRVLVASPEYLERLPKPVELDTLPSLDLIGYSNAAVSQIWRFQNPNGEEIPARVVPRLSFNNGSAMKNAALQGLGITILPIFIVNEELANGRLKAIEIAETPVPDDMHAIYLGGNATPRKTRAFIDHLIAELEPQP